MGVETQDDGQELGKRSVFAVLKHELKAPLKQWSNNLQNPAPQSHQNMGGKGQNKFSENCGV